MGPGYAAGGMWRQSPHLCKATSIRPSPGKAQGMTSVEQRIEDLEMRIAYQDKTIADLNDVITAQWKKIEKLERQLQRLDEEVQSLDSRDAPPVTRPPHY